MARTTLFPIHKRQMLGAGIGLCIFLLGMFVINNISGAKKNLIADAFLIDITITFPLIWYFMVIRPLKFKTWNLMLVFTICCIAAFIILPDQQRSYIKQIRRLTFFIELAAFAYLLIKARKIKAEYQKMQKLIPDFPYSLHKSMMNVFGDTKIIKFLASELTVLRFALLFWKKQGEIPSNAKAYTNYKNSGYIAIFSVILFVCLVEISVTHIVLLQYSKITAIVVSMLSLYSVLFIVSDISAMLKSPLLTMQDQILLRAGLRWRVLVNRSEILSIKKIKESYQHGKNCFNGAVLKNSANILIEFKQPIQIERMYRTAKTADQIIMNLDIADDLIADLSPKGQ